MSSVMVLSLRLWRDNTPSCVNMRALIAEANPGIVSLSDKSQVADLLIEDLRERPFLKQTLNKCHCIANFIRNHQYVLAMYHT